MIRQLLLPLDDGDDGARAVDWTRSIAERGSAEVLLLRVGDWPLFGTGAGYGWSTSFRAGRLTAVRQSLASAPSGNVRVLSPRVMTSDAILQKARRGKVSLIVLAYRPEGAWSRFLRGHTAQRVLWESPIPVLAVPEQDSRRPPAGSRILYIHNGDEAALQGSRTAIEIAQLFESRVSLLQLRLRGPSGSGLLSRWWNGETGPASGDGSSAPFQVENLASLFEKRGVPVLRLPDSRAVASALSSPGLRAAVDLVILAKPLRGDRACHEVARQVLDEMRVPLLVLRERPAPELGVPPQHFRFRV
jgi:nucleotide-binding universal stress UspA family protein